MDDATGVVVIVNVAEVEPAETTTVVGGVALVDRDVRVTDAPPAGAGPFSVTVPVDVSPPRTDVGDTEIAETVAGVIVRVAV